MGPVPSNSLPSPPRFAWDAKSPPWTDGKGNQERFKNAVNDWKEYHDSLPDTSSNKLAPQIQGIVLKSQLYGQAADLIAELTNEQLKGENGVQLIVDAVYQRDFLSVISEAFDGFNSLLNTRRSQNESLKNFEMRFSAAVTKFNSLSNITRLPQYITALMLLSNSSIESSQRVSALAAAAPNGTVFSDQSSNDDYLKAVTYKQLASVVKQCEKASVNASTSMLSASAASTSNQGNRGRSSNFRRPSISALKRHPCHTCNKYGHWKDSHNKDGSLQPGVKCYDTAAEYSVSLDSGGSSSNANNNSGGKKKAVSFNMAVLSSNNGSTTLLPAHDNEESIGPLVDDGAPYSAIGNVELRLLFELLGHQDNVVLDPIPSSLQGHTHWQYGVGDHSSASRPIIGSIEITAVSGNGRLVTIRHLVLDGSSQWVIGKNVTKYADILHAHRNALQFYVDGTTDYFSMIDKGFLSYLPMSTFSSETRDMSVISCLNGNLSKNRPWNEIKAIIDKVHKHVCGHANFTDMKLLLDRNGLWSDVVSNYVSQLIENCVSCRATAPPQPSRKVSISSLSREFNKVVSVDHFYLESLCLFHCMDAATRFSAAFIVKSPSMDEAVLAFEACWVSQFWLPGSVQGDNAFAKGAFSKFLDERDISFRPVPPRCHSKNPIESKHGVIRSIFLKLCTHDNSCPEIQALRAVYISNDLYGNDVMSSFELAKGFTNPLYDGSVTSIPDDVIDAHNRLQAKRKMALILKSKSTNEPHVTVGDMIEVYSNTGFGKKGRWSAPKIVLSVDLQARTVLVPAKGGRRATVALEDIRIALPEDSFASTVQAAIDAVDDTIDDVAQSALDGDNDSNCNEITPPVTVCETHEDADFSDGHNILATNENLDASTVNRGDRVMVYWPLDKVHYAATVKTLHRDGHVTVLYDDGEKERLNLDDERWHYDNTTVNASTASVSAASTDIDHEPPVLQSMLDHFGNKAFMRHQAQGFEQFPLVKSYSIEEEKFLKTVRPVPCSDIPRGANVINSHVLYKVKQNDDLSLKLKARIAPHGNEDDLKNVLASDCTTCPPTGLRIVESIASLFGWTVCRADVKAAFLQTGTAGRDVYVKPPKESRMRSTHMWLLLTASYGLVNANAKWQVQSDDCFLNLGLTQCQQVPQLFYKHKDGKLVLIIAKIVDDIKAAGSEDNAKIFIKRFNQSFKLGSVSHGPGQLRFFGINKIQDDDTTVSNNADDKLNALTEYPMSRNRRKEFGELLNSIEKAYFASTNSSLGWIGTAASPFCSFYASYLQQKTPDTKVCHLVEQQNVLRKLKKLGTVINYPKPADSAEYELLVLVFADASRRDENGQLGILTGLLLVPLANESIFHAISWISHKSKRPVKSVPAAEILAAGEGIDEAKGIAHAYSEVINANVGVHLCVDSKDLFTSLSTQRNYIDSSIRGDVACIRFEFQVGNVEKITWIAGKINLADVLTKKDSPLTDALQLTLFNGRLNIPFEDFAETKSTEKNYG